MEKQTRIQIGQMLKEKREAQNINRQHLVNSGLKFDQVKAIEEGSTNYTIDSLLIYLIAINCAINLESTS